MTQLALIKQSTKARNANRVPIPQMKKSNSSDKMVPNSFSFSFQIDFRYFAEHKVYRLNRGVDRERN